MFVNLTYLQTHPAAAAAVEAVALMYGVRVSCGCWGKWVTPGPVDLHSHIGIMPALGLDGGYWVFHASIIIFNQHLNWPKGIKDGNSYKAPTLPCLRSINGLNMHNVSYELVMVGGVTTMQILPGSTNNIGESILFSSVIWFWHTCEGGQFFLIKLWPTAEHTQTSNILRFSQMLFRNVSSVSESGHHHLYRQHRKYILPPVTQYISCLYSP